MAGGARKWHPRPVEPRVPRVADPEPKGVMSALREVAMGVDENMQNIANALRNQPDSVLEAIYNMLGDGAATFPAGIGAVGTVLRSDGTSPAWSTDGSSLVGVDADLLDGIDSTGFALAAHDHDARYYTEAELDAGQLDTRYYTEAEVNAFLAAQDDLSEMGDVSIAAPADAEVLTFETATGLWKNKPVGSHTHVEADITDLGDYARKGGDTDAAPLVVGTNDAQSLRLETNAIARADIRSDGKVVISQRTDPTAATARGDLLIYRGSSGAAPWVGAVGLFMETDGVGENGIGVQQLTPDNRIAFLFTHTTPTNAIQAQISSSGPGASPAGQLAFKSGGNVERIVIDSIGRVKIGPGVIPGGAGGDLMLNNTSSLRSVNAAAAASIPLISLDAADIVRIGGTRTVATVPANFSASHYIRLRDQNGNDMFIPCMTAAW